MEYNKDPLTEGYEHIGRYLKLKYRFYLLNLIVYVVFAGFWIWKEIWIIVGANIVVMYFFTASLMKERELYKHWKYLKIISDARLQRVESQWEAEDGKD